MEDSWQPFASACQQQEKSGAAGSWDGMGRLYTPAIAAAASLGDYERALAMLSDSCQASDGNSRNHGNSRNNGAPHLHTLTAVMCACLAAKRLDLRLKFIPPCPHPMHARAAGIAALCGSGQVQQALDLIVNERKENARTLSPASTTPTVEQFAPPGRKQPNKTP